VAEEYDLIVVGGGSAGCAMAGRLAEDGRYKVLLIEAGASDRHYRSRIPALTSAVVQNPDFDWCYVTEPDASIGGRADVWPGGRRLGGGSAINGMMFIRGHAWDYDHWAELGATGWDYRSVLPYFRRMENNERGSDAWRGQGGPLSVSEGRARYPITDAWVRAAQSAGIARSTDLNGETAEGVDYVQVSQRAGMRCSSATAYIHRSPHRERLDVALEAQVLKILVTDKRATGVRYLQDGVEKTATARAGVVLSAGAMNSPRMLMLSGIGPAAHLAELGIPLVHDLPGVGANLQDHVGTHLVNEVNATTLNADARGLRAAMQVASFALRRKGILTTAIAHAQAFVRSRPGLEAPNLQIAFAAFAFDLDEQGKLVLRKNPSVSTLIGLMRPSHRGAITLRSADPLAPPVIRHQLLGSDDDVEQIVEGIAIARRIIAQPEIARYVTGEQRPGAALTDPEQLKGYVRMASIPLYHPVGTCRIGRDAMAVVDPELRLHGIDGLWVADASVMPSLPAGNTNATAIMIGDKGADHVLCAIGGNARQAA
jgi:choline dehydrogenase-like flavoprotein